MQKQTGGQKRDSRKQEEARSSSSAFNLPKDKMSHFTFQTEYFPQTLPLVYQLIPTENSEHGGHSMIKKH